MYPIATWITLLSQCFSFLVVICFPIFAFPLKHFPLSFFFYYLLICVALPLNLLNFVAFFLSILISGLSFSFFSFSEISAISAGGPNFFHTSTRPRSRPCTRLCCPRRRPTLPGRTCPRRVRGPWRRRRCTARRAPWRQRSSARWSPGYRRNPPFFFFLTFSSLALALLLHLKVLIACPHLSATSKNWWQYFGFPLFVQRNIVGL